MDPVLANAADQLLPRQSLPRFRFLWALLALDGCCDDLDGAEYARIYGEWVSADRPEPIVSFITKRANRGGQS